MAYLFIESSFKNNFYYITKTRQRVSLGKAFIVRIYEIKDDTTFRQDNKLCSKHSTFFILMTIIDHAPLITGERQRIPF